MAPPAGTVNTQPVVGNKSNNNAAPGTTNVGALVAVANASNPSYTEGNEVLLSTDLTGNIRTVDKSTVAQGSTTSGQTGPIVQGATTTSAPTYTTGQTNPLSLTTAGALRVDNSANTQPVSGTITANAGTGTFTTADNQTLTDNNAFTDGTSKVFMGGYVLDEVAGTALTENDAAAARVDAKRAQVFVIEDETIRGRRATVTTSLPASNASGLTVREVAQGQQTMANSRPVVLASDHDPIVIQVGDTNNLGAFGRLRVAEAFTIFDANVSQTDQSLAFDTSLTGGATSTHLPNQAAIRLRCGTASGDIAIRQSKEYFHYQPGHSFLFYITGLLGAIKTNVTQRIGCFDANNGIFFEQDGTNLKVALRSFVTGSPVTTYVNQSSWNLDKLDGTGTSGVTLDTSKVQIFVVDYQWLGVGRVRVGLDINGQTIYCHQFLTSNVGTDVWASTGSLPVRWSIQNTGTTASNTDLYACCCSIQSEGGYNPLGIVRSIDTNVTAITVSTTLVPILSLSLKSANTRATLIPLSISLHITNNTDVHWKLLLNPTLTGASFTSVSNTAVSQYDVTATALTGGEVIASGYTMQGSPYSLPLDSLLRINSNIAGASDILTLAAVRVETTNATIYASMSYKELY